MQTPQELLSQEYLARKKRNPHYSLRAFARWMEISPAQLSQMIAGKRTITVKTLKKVSAKLGLSPLEKRSLMGTLDTQTTSKPPSPFKILEEDQFRLISDWYHLAIYNLAQMKGAKADPRWLAQRLNIPVDEASQALSRLERMGIVQLKPTFKQLAEPFEVISQTPSQAIQKYHRQALNLASEKIETVPVSLREYQSLSLPLNPLLLERLRKLTDEYLDEVQAIARTKEPTEVYNFNVQIYPITKSKENQP